MVKARIEVERALNVLAADCRVEEERGAGMSIPISITRPLRFPTFPARMGTVNGGKTYRSQWMLMTALSASSAIFIVTGAVPERQKFRRKELQA